FHSLSLISLHPLASLSLYPTAEFSVRLYHHMQGGDENIIFSPLSVALALGMVELGARGASLTEIRQALGFSHLPKDVEFSMLQNLTGALYEDDARYIIRLANSLFLQSGVTFNPTFLRLMRKLFRAEVETVDFSESAAVAEQINGWVENHTEGKIRDLLSADDFSSVTRLTLVNAVYFRGSWKNQFRPENTRTFSFSKDDGSEVQTLMMYQQGEFYYGEFSDGSSEAGGVYQVLEMPYEGEDMSMLIVLPRQEVPLAALEPIIKAPLLEEWANNVKRQKVEVYLPKFKVEQKIDLRETLQDLGIKKIFTKDADLSAMTDGKDLFIGKAVQKAYLEVTEEGAEGAAGSGMIALTRTLVLYPQVMADHPFFFVIRNRRTGSILFMGRVMMPEVVESSDFDNDSM
uniref:Serpin domain-containing protein n=1 Tax=Esox lucius TaxID=8010 RepID=A0A3P8ZRP3_ESOLU